MQNDISSIRLLFYPVVVYLDILFTYLYGVYYNEYKLYEVIIREGFTNGRRENDSFSSKWGNWVWC